MVARDHPSFSQAQNFPSFSQASNCFVTFEFGAGIPPFTLEISPGGVIKPPPDPVRKGYVIDGWFLDSGFTAEWNFADHIGGDNFTLYAKWELIVYEIIYYLSGGVNHPGNPATYTVEDPDIVLGKPTRGDDDFIAWYTDVLFSCSPVEVVKTGGVKSIVLFARFLTKRKITGLAERDIADRYEGDPKLYLTPDGAEMRYEAGQPFMEKGLENQALISLFTKEGWCGNVFLPPENKIGSDFEKTCSGSITLLKLADIENSAVRALESRAFVQVDAKVRNPKSDNLYVEATVHGGGVLSLSREGALWRNQRKRI